MPKSTFKVANLYDQTPSWAFGRQMTALPPTARSVDLDETAPRPARGPPLRPRKALETTRDALAKSCPSSGLPPSARREPRYLELEAALRIQLRSIAKSWRTVRSGLRAYAVFMSAHFPHSPQFPVSSLAIRCWAPHFSCAGTLGQYISHLKTASRLLQIPHDDIDSAAAPLLRGAKKLRETLPLPRITGDILDKLIDIAENEGDVLGARMYAIAYTFLSRVQSELFPLQLDGQRGPGARDWHSRVTLHEDRVAVTLRTRKNSSRPTTLTRACICSKHPRRCGACALRALVNSRARREARPADRLLVGLRASQATETLRQRCIALGLPRSGWHAFRRGSATDIIRSGGTVAFLLHAGGWRSSAFLRYLVRQDLEDRAYLEQTANDSESDA